MRRFLSSAEPEVLSISGRWGVGKTHGWREALEEARCQRPLPMARYAYVSAFGVRSLDNLKTTIFQSTVRLDRDSIEPTIASFQDNLTSISGIANLAERGGRKGLNFFQSLASYIPFGDKAAQFITPGAALLIKNQIVCIDDIERAGEGLRVADIMGFASTLREEKACKVILLLNEEGLENDKDSFKKYLEKVVDQAIAYLPTPAESAACALSGGTQTDKLLASKTTALGITNIRVIKRIARFLDSLLPALKDVQQTVIDRAVSSIALLGWCVFEPKFAPGLDFVRSHDRYSGLFPKKEPSEEEAQWNALLAGYGFSYFGKFDSAILNGLQTGGFDLDRVEREAAILNRQEKKALAHVAIRRPWDVLVSSFDDTEDEFKKALVESVENHGAEMTPTELNDVVGVLRELDDHANADRMIQIYMEYQLERPRGFFTTASSGTRELDPVIREAFDRRMKALPLERSPRAILLKIAQDKGWNPEDVDFLSSLSEDDYYNLFKSTRGKDLQNIVHSGLLFGQFADSSEQQKEISRKTVSALKRLGGESRLNAMRVKPYIAGGDTSEPEA